MFGKGGNGGDPNTLYFTDGINTENSRAFWRNCDATSRSIATLRQRSRCTGVAWLAQEAEERVRLIQTPDFFGDAGRHDWPRSSRRGFFCGRALCNDGAGLSANLLGVARNLSDGRCWPGKPTLPPP